MTVHPVPRNSQPVLRYRSFRALTTIGFQAGISPFAESHCGALAIVPLFIEVDLLEIVRQPDRQALPCDLLISTQRKLPPLSLPIGENSVMFGSPVSVCGRVLPFVKVVVYAAGSHILYIGYKQSQVKKYKSRLADGSLRHRGRSPGSREPLD